jgi:hypothetical protein
VEIKMFWVDTRKTVYKNTFTRMRIQNKQLENKTEQNYAAFLAHLLDKRRKS